MWVLVFYEEKEVVGLLVVSCMDLMKRAGLFCVSDGERVDVVGGLLAPLWRWVWSEHGGAVSFGVEEQL